MDVSAVGRPLETCTANHKQVRPSKTFAERKTVEKKVTFTIETEEDDSIGVLCEEHANGLPGTYKVKGVLM